MTKTQTFQNSNRLGMQVNASDYVRAFLTASNILAALVVLALFLVWLFAALPDSTPGGFHLPMDSKVTPTESKIEVQHAEPGSDEFPNLAACQLATSQFAADISAVTEAISNVSTTASHGLNQGDGSRKAGSPPPLKPEHQRWIIHYNADDIDQYAGQLSELGIDIGVIHTTSNQIWRIHDAGKTPSVIQSDRKRENTTLRFTHKDATMQQWDKTFVRRENIDLKDTIVCQFYSEEAKAQLRKAESAAVLEAGKSIDDVRKTVFKIAKADDKFTFDVAKIEFR